MCELTIVDYELPDYTHNLYDVGLNQEQIHTIVTNTPSYVDTWISETHAIRQSNPDTHVVVGLDVEWRPSYSRNIESPVATVQLCVGRRCLIFQVLHSPCVPPSLAEFLNNRTYSFVGVGIESDVEKLILDHNLTVANTVDLRHLAAQTTGNRELRNAGLKTLAREVLGLEIDKPKRVTMSRWDNEWLTPAQVQYACIDAFLSFKIGMSLNAAGSISPNASG